MAKNPHKTYRNVQLQKVHVAAVRWKLLLLAKEYRAAASEVRVDTRSTVNGRWNLTQLYLTSQRLLSHKIIE